MNGANAYGKRLVSFVSRVDDIDFEGLNIRV
jgi:hypothetical protein